MEKTNALQNERYANIDKFYTFYNPHPQVGCRKLFLYHLLNERGLTTYGTRFYLSKRRWRRVSIGINVAIYKRKIGSIRSEEHTSELQSRFELVCRLLLERKNKRTPPR